jgi:hypothetical protein
MLLREGEHGGALLIIEGRVKAINAISKANIFACWQETSYWRELAGWLAKQQKMPRFIHPVVVHAYHFKTSGVLPDASSNFFAVKGAVDGLVDAKVLVDDNPQYVRSITFHAAEKRRVEGLGLELVNVIE